MAHNARVIPCLDVKDGRGHKEKKRETFFGMVGNRVAPALPRHPDFPCARLTR